MTRKRWVWVGVIVLIAVIILAVLSFNTRSSHGNGGSSFEPVAQSAI